MTPILIKQIVMIRGSRGARPANLVLAQTQNPFSVEESPSKMMFPMTEFSYAPLTPFYDFNNPDQFLAPQFQVPMLHEQTEIYHTSQESQPHAAAEPQRFPNALEMSQTIFVAHEPQVNQLICDIPSDSQEGTDFERESFLSPSSIMTSPGSDELMDVIADNFTISEDQHYGANQIQSQIQIPGQNQNQNQQPPPLWLQLPEVIPHQVCESKWPLRRPKPRTKAAAILPPLQYTTEPVSSEADAPTSKIFLSQEETKERELSLKDRMQTIDLSDLQKKFVTDFRFRKSKHMMSKNNKKCTRCHHTFSNTGRHAFHYHDHGELKNKKGEKREFCPESDCPMAAIGFCTRQSVLRHIKSIHGNVKVECSRCSRVFSRRDGLLRHFESRACTEAAPLQPKQTKKKNPMDYFERNLIMPL